MVSSVRSPVRVGMSQLVANRGIGKLDPVEKVSSHGEAFATSRDFNSGLADSSIELSLYSMDKQTRRLKMNKHVSPASRFHAYA